MASNDEHALGEDVHVMIVDDHELVRDGLRQLIEGQNGLRVCGEASSVDEACDRFRELRPQLVIVDLTLRESSGLDFIKWVQTEGTNTKVIVSSMRDECDYGERAFRLGAVGYVSKQEPASKILVAIERVLEGRLYFSEAMTERLLRRVQTGAAVVDESPLTNLSDREIEILGLLGRGLSTEEIAGRLHLSANTIGTYRERLKTKLQLKNAAELTRFAIVWSTASEST